MTILLPPPKQNKLTVKFKTIITYCHAHRFVVSCTLTDLASGSEPQVGFRHAPHVCHSPWTSGYLGHMVCSRRLIPGPRLKEQWLFRACSYHAQEACFTGQAYSKLLLSDSQTSYWPKQVPNQTQSQKVGKYSLSTRVWMENSITGAQRLEPMINLSPPLQLPATTLVPAAALDDRDGPPGPLCPQLLLQILLQPE